MKQTFSRVVQHVSNSLGQAKKFWPLSLIGSLALAYLGGTIFITIPSGYYVPHKMVAAFVATPFIFGGLSYLLGALILPRWASISKKNWLELAALSAVVAVAIFFLLPNPKPLIPQIHQLKLTASGEKNIQSSGSAVEVRQIRTLDGKDIPLDQFHRSGDWQFSAGELLSLHGGSESVAEMTGTISGGVIISLRYVVGGGKVTIRWDEEERLIDLFTYTDGTVEEFLFEGIRWSQLSPFQFTALLTTYILYILGLFMVIFFFGFVILSRLIRPKIAQILLLLAYAACLVVFIQVKFSYYDFSKPYSFADSKDYVQSADLPLNSLAFWAGRRSFTYPLTLKLLDVHYIDAWSNRVMDKVRLFQFWLSIASWALLAWLVSLRVRQNWLKPIAFACILFFSLSFEIGKWDSLMLSESLSISLFALLIAHWIGWPLLEGKKTGRLIQWLFLIELSVVTILYSFVRDSNPYFLLVAGAVFFLKIVLKKKEDTPKRFSLIYFFVILLIVVTQNITISVGNRWQVFIYDHLALRIMANDSARNFFAAHGLPVTDDLMSIVGMRGFQYQEMITNDPKMQPVKQWVEQSGKSTYLLYLVSNFGESLLDPIRNVKPLLNDDRLTYAHPIYPSRPFSKQVGAISDAFYFRSPVLEWLAGIILLMASIVWILKLRANSVWFVVALLALGIYPMMFIIWHGEPMEIGRHAILVSVQFRLAAWIAFIFIVDGVTNRVFSIKG